MQARKLHSCMKRLKQSLYFSIFADFIFHGVKYGEYNAINFIRHIIVPKADNFTDGRIQVFCSFLITVFLFQVLTSIQFNNEFLLDADKVGYVFAKVRSATRVAERLDAASGSAF